MELKISKKTNILIITIIFFTIIILQYNNKNHPSEEKLFRYQNTIDLTLRYVDQYTENFNLKLLNNDKFVLTEHIGNKPIVLYFFSTLCMPCISCFPELNRFYAKNNDEIKMFGITFNEDEYYLYQFLEKNNVIFNISNLKNSEIHDMFEIQYYPTTIVIGVNGRIALYEMSSIMNAEVILGTVLNEQQLLKEKGLAITPEEYNIIISQ